MDEGGADAGVGFLSGRAVAVPMPRLVQSQPHPAGRTVLMSPGPPRTRWGDTQGGGNRPHVHDVDGHGAGGGDEHDTPLDVVVGQEQALGRQVDQDARDHPDGEHGEQGPQDLCGEPPRPCITPSWPPWQHRCLMWAPSTHPWGCSLHGDSGACTLHCPHLWCWGFAGASRVTRVSWRHAVPMGRAP